MSPVAAADEDVPQELFVQRDAAVTLPQGRLEAALEASYARKRTIFVGDRIQQYTADIRYALFNNVEIATTIPYYISDRETVGLNDTVTRTVQSFGDASVRVNAQLWSETADYPGALVTAGAVLPTGQSPFAFGPSGLGRGAPYDIFQNVTSVGLWGVRGGMQFVKTVDPLVLFFGFNMQHFFPDEVSGFKVQPGNQYSVNGGFGFAVSERTTLGTVFNLAYTDRLRVDNRTFEQTNTEQAQLRFVVVQRIFPDTWLEPSVSVGISRESPDYTLGVGLRRRF